MDRSLLNIMRAHDCLWTCWELLDFHDHHGMWGVTFQGVGIFLLICRPAALLLLCGPSLGSQLLEKSMRVACLSFSMKYCSHLTVADSCCKSADRGRSHQLDTFAARISVSKAFQKRNRCVCESSLEACQIIHSLDACLVNPFQHSPSENQAFFSKVSQFI